MYIVLSLKELAVEREAVSLEKLVELELNRIAGDEEDCDFTMRITSEYEVGYIPMGIGMQRSSQRLDKHAVQAPEFRCARRCHRTSVSKPRCCGRDHLYLPGP